MAVVVPTWTSKNTGDSQPAVEMNQLANAVINNANELTGSQNTIQTQGQEIDGLQSTIQLVLNLLNGSFNPVQISGLWGWWSADFGVSGTTTITSWDDKSGNGRSFVSESGKEPELNSSAINSKPAIRRGSINASMLNSVNFPDITTSGLTMFMVASQSNAGGLDTTGTFMIAGNERNILVSRNGGTSGLRVGINTTSGSRIETLSGLNEDQFYTIRAFTNNTMQSLSINGSVVATAVNVPQSYAEIPLQLFANFSSSYGNKSFAEILFYNRVLTSDEIAVIEGYLKSKYNHY